MHTMIRIMLVLAALAYGAMPLTGTAGVMPDAATMPATEASVHAEHHGQMNAEDNSNMASHDVMAPEGDCPHPGKTMATGHCAACLTLAADIQIAESGKPARSALCPTHAATLTSRAAPPLDPPPRA